MQNGEEPKVDEAIKQIAALLATACERRAGIRRVHAVPEPLPSKKNLLFRASGAFMNWMIVVFGPLRNSGSGSKRSLVTGVPFCIRCIQS
jgi:hypothetical protein